MRQETAGILQCCICGREKTEIGWHYPDPQENAGIQRIQSFCAECYDNEIMKLRMEAAELAEAVAG